LVDSRPLLQPHKSWRERRSRRTVDSPQLSDGCHEDCVRTPGRLHGSTFRRLLRRSQPHEYAPDLRRPRRVLAFHPSCIEDVGTLPSANLLNTAPEFGALICLASPLLIPKSLDDIATARDRAPGKRAGARIPKREPAKRSSLVHRRQPHTWREGRAGETAGRLPFTKIGRLLQSRQRRGLRRALQLCRLNPKCSAGRCSVGVLDCRLLFDVAERRKHMRRELNPLSLGTRGWWNRAGTECETRRIRVRRNIRASY
jgi:hypothetical protein